MIIGLFGDLGQGKTLSAIRLLTHKYAEGYSIYSNIGLSFPYTNLTMDMMIDIAKGLATVPERSVFFIDEITLYLDSRNSGTGKINKLISYFLLQTRKLGDQDVGLYFFYTTQFPRLIDIRLWLLTTIKIVCNKDEFMNEKIFTNTWIIDKINGVIIEKEYFLGKDFYKFYDTKQIVRIPESKYG